MAVFHYEMTLGKFIRSLVRIILRRHSRQHFGTTRDQELNDDDRDGSDCYLARQGYTVEEQIGEGSFSVVMRAYSKPDEQHIAIKIIKKKSVPRLYLEKFLPREVEMLKSLEHQNVIKFLKLNETKKTVYISMNLAANGSLLNMIKENRRIEEGRACRWFHHLTDGVAYCHSKGIAHRDLKCENLLLDDKFVLKIIDFSFARASLPFYLMNDEENVNRNVILSSTFCGSYAYACPEILLKKPYEPHLSDTWSMGIVLYAMLYGHLPFDDTNYDTLLRAIQEPINFHRRPPLSNAAKALISKILTSSSKRVYIPKIRNDAWYLEAFDPSMEEEYSALRAESDRN